MRFVTGMGPSPGISVGNDDAIMQLASGLTCAAGDCLSVDQTKVDSSLRFYEVRAPLTADFLSASDAVNVQPYMCIALEAQATAAGLVRCRFAGEVDALIEDSGLAIGAKLTGKNTLRVLDTQGTGTGSGVRVLAILKEATTATSQIKRVDFDGITGVVSSPRITNTT